MMTEQEQRLMSYVDDAREAIFSSLDFLWKHPETGYTEWVSDKFLKEQWQSFGLTVVEAGNIPGFYADLDTGRPGPMFAIMGELDALDIANHPCSVNGMNHSCGHCAQGAAMIGVAYALSREGALDGLSGRIRLMMVPAEELIQIPFREKLRKEGTIRYFGGKQEFLYRGYFDDVDLAEMVHTSTWKGRPGVRFSCVKGHNGVVAKTFTYHGKSSHAGGSPESGINAQYAAVLGLNACNALRETFPDQDHIRFHPIMHGVSSAVNIIPNELSLESYVRGASFAAMKRENDKLNRALAGAAVSMGATVTISDRPGYAPEFEDDAMMRLAEECCKKLAGDEAVSFDYDAFSTGSSDFGDLTCVMPGIQFRANGATGTPHGIDYMISDPENACVDSAKAQVLVAYALLSGGAEKAKTIVDNYQPVFGSIREYVEFMDEFTKDLQPVEYREDGLITVTLR